MSEHVSWFNNSNIDEALAAATSARKPILIDFWSPTCLGCAKLYARTYQNPQLQRVLAEHVVAIKYNTTTPESHFRELMGRYAHSWHPHILITDHHLIEARRSIGYLTPADFIATLHLGLGSTRLHQKDFTLSVAHFTSAASANASDDITAEALYWAGVADYRVQGGLDALRPWWRDLMIRFPRTSWAHRADCLDVEIPEAGFVFGDLSSVHIRPSFVDLRQEPGHPRFERLVTSEQVPMTSDQ